MADYTLEPITEETKGYTLEPIKDSVPVEPTFQPLRDQSDNLWDSISSIFPKDVPKMKAKATNALVYSEMLGIRPDVAYTYHDQISRQVQDKMAGEKIITETHGLSGSVKSGVESSLVGMMAKRTIPAPFESVSQWERWINGITTMGLDLPVYIAGYAIGGGTPITGTAGAFGFHAGLRQMLVDRYTKGEVSTPGELFDRIKNAATETVKGEVVGATVGAAGKFAPAQFKLASEIATMTTASKLIEGQLPTVQDFVDNAAMMLVLHYGIKGYEKVKTRLPEVRDALTKAYVDSGAHPTTVLDVSSLHSERAADILDEIYKTSGEIKANNPPEPVEKPLPSEQDNAGVFKDTGAGKIVEPAPSSQSEIAKTADTGVIEGKPPVEMKQGEQIGGEQPAEGIGKESKLALRSEAEAIKAKLIGEEGFDNLTKYDVMSMDEQINRSQEIMDSDWKQAVRIAMDEEVPPIGLRPLAVFTSVMERAEQKGDYETLQKLATESPLASRASAFGQEIKAADVLQQDSPVRAIQDVVKTRSDAIKQAAGKKPSTDKKKTERASRDVEKAKQAFEDHAAQASIERIIKANKKRGERKAAKEILNAELSQLVKEFNSKLDGLHAGIPVDALPVLIEIARNRIEAGIIVAKDVFADVHQILTEAGHKFTEREIRDAITQYGITKKPNPDPVEQKLAEVKRIGRLFSALEDVQSGKLPERSGFQRPDPVELERSLRKEINQAMKDAGLDVGKSDVEQQKTSLDAAKKRLTNLKESLDRQITARQKDTKVTKSLEYDAEAKKLQSEVEELRGILDSVAPNPTEPMWRKAENKIAALSERLAAKEGKIASGDIAVEKKVPGQPITPETELLNGKIKEANKTIAEMRKAGVEKTDPKIKALEDSIVKYERKIAEGDLSRQAKPEPKPVSSEVAKLREIRDGLRETLDQMRRDAQPKKDPEVTKLQAYKKRLETENKKLQEQFDKGEVAKKTKREPLTLDAEGKKLKAELERKKKIYNDIVKGEGSISKEEIGKIVELAKDMDNARKAMDSGGNRLDYGAAKVIYENYLSELKGSKEPIATQLKQRTQEFKTTWEENRAKAVWKLGVSALRQLADNSVAMVATLDNSFIGRQGLHTLMTHPSVWWDGAVNSFADIIKTLGGKEAHDALMADIYSRPNYVNGEYVRAKIIPKAEEQFPSTLPERIPGLGRIFKAAEYAFTGSALRMRTGLYDLISDQGKKNGVDFSKKKEIESLGKIINSLTARGQWGERGEPAVVRLILWAPKMLKGNIDVLTAHGLGMGLESAFARKQAAMNIFKIVAETATVMAIANALKPGSAETDPTSADFGKIKVGKRRIDITGGAGSIVVLASRLYTGQYRTALDITIPYQTGFGKMSRLDAFESFIEGKTNPPASVVRDWMKGMFYDKSKFTWGGASYRAFTPITLQQIIQAGGDPSADAVLGVLADAIGFSSTSWKPTYVYQGGSK